MTTGVKINQKLNSEKSVTYLNYDLLHCFGPSSKNWLKSCKKNGSISFPDKYSYSVIYIYQPSTKYGTP